MPLSFFRNFRPSRSLPRSIAPLGIIASLVVGGPVAAQVSRSEKKPRPPLAHYVPATTGLFVSIQELGEVDDALRQTQAWRILPLLAGQSGSSLSLKDLRSTVSALLGPGAAAETSDFSSVEVALVAPSWNQIGAASWVVRPPKATSLDKWFPVERRSRTESVGGGDFFLSEAGMTIGLKDGVAVLVRGAAVDREKNAVLRLLARGEGKPLAEQEQFRRLGSYLPPKALAIAYYQDDEVASEPEPGWIKVSRMRSAVAGLYSGEGRIDIAIRGALHAASPRRLLAPAAVDRLFRLPATTLVAWAGAVDLPKAYAAAVEHSSDGVLGRFVALAESLRSANAEDGVSFPAIGPHILLAWDQELEDHSQGPEVAVLVESSEARAVAGELEQMAQTLLEFTRKLEGEAEVGQPSELTHSNHLGVHLTHVPLAPIVRWSSAPLARLFSGGEVSWAVQGDWLMVALSRRHLQRLIDAQHNLVPALANMPDMQDLRKRRAHLGGFMVAQPDLAAEVLQGWLSKRGTQEKTWFDVDRWSQIVLAEGTRANRLGIGMRTEQEPGVVVVARVYPGTPAEGKLEPEDRIVGVDGRLLDFAGPNLDLRRRWSTAAPPGGHSFRVIRDEMQIEVQLEAEETGVGLSNLLTRPVDALSDLASIGRSIRFASWSVHATDEMHYSALISLRFATPRAPEASR